MEIQAPPQESEIYTEFVTQALFQVLSAFPHTVSLQLHDVGAAILSTLHMGKLRHRKVMLQLWVPQVIV